MNKIPLLIFLLISTFSCKNSLHKQESIPHELSTVFERHGGLEAWRKMRTLSFNLNNEAHTIDLNTRKTIINAATYSLGYDGKEVWLKEYGNFTFKKNKNFYYNLYFYFYAMPFVLADNGIIYEKTADLIFEGREYSGYKISYKNNIGSSPDDNYKIYFDKETFQMKWLAYTVTFSAKKPSDSYNLIHYHSWKKEQGILLPQQITWYSTNEKGMPESPKAAPVEFSLPLLSETQLPASFFEKPTE